MNKKSWQTVLNIIIAVASAIAGVIFGSCLQG